MRKPPEDTRQDIEDTGSPAQPHRQVERWTHQEPCAEAQANAPEIALYLSLHCPRCGQFAAFDAQTGPRRCLLSVAKPHSYLLDRDHHSQNH